MGHKIQKYLNFILLILLIIVANSLTNFLLVKIYDELKRDRTKGANFFCINYF